MRSTVRRGATGSAVSVRVEGDVLELVFAEHVSADDVERCAALAARELGFSLPSFFLIDAQRTTSYDPALRGPAAALLEFFKMRGVTYGVCVASSGAVRMIGSAIAFVTAMRIDFCSSREEANARFAVEREKSRPRG